MSEAANDDQIEDVVQRLAELHERHYRLAGPVQRVASRVTGVLGRPASSAVALILVVAWIAGNVLAPWLGYSPADRLPFPDLDFVATVTALLATLLILTTQRHEGELANRRSQLTLQLAVLSERKLAKVIELLEEQRRDNPMLNSRKDDEAELLARPADPAQSLERIEATHRDGS